MKSGKRRFGLLIAASLVSVYLGTVLLVIGLFQEPIASALALGFGSAVFVFAVLAPIALLARWRGYRALVMERSAGPEVDATGSPPIVNDLRDINTSLQSWRERALVAEAALQAKPPKPRAQLDPAATAADGRWLDGERGRGARFTYVDSDGVVTDREVRNWHSRGAYIEAFCLERRESRTFRKDRIEDWVQK